VIDDDGAFHVYVSQLAAHTRNLLASGRASVLVIEDESAATQPLARRRLTFQCTAVPVPRDTATHAATLAALRAKLGPAFDLITGLGDFRLICLRPVSGRLVAGFGQAFDVDPRDWSPRAGPLGPGRDPAAGPR
jgi:putative heme iron utilization protein